MFHQFDVIACHALISMESAQYPLPHEYIPERWLRDNTFPLTKEAHPFAYMPFGYGTRTCIGRRFAEMKLETLLLTVCNFLFCYKFICPRDSISHITISRLKLCVLLKRNNDTNQKYLKFLPQTFYDPSLNKIGGTERGGSIAFSIKICVKFYITQLSIKVSDFIVLLPTNLFAFVSLFSFNFLLIHLEI